MFNACNAYKNIVNNIQCLFTLLFDKTVDAMHKQELIFDLVSKAK
jgi:hypothetical protein